MNGNLWNADISADRWKLARRAKVGNDDCEAVLYAFTLAMGEVIRILYRSREKDVVLLNSKAGDFATYSLPRLSVSNLGEEQEALFNRNRSETCHRYESRSGKSSDLSRNFKNICKTPCSNVERAKMRPASKKILRSNGT